jgi:hypothetical protein
VPSRFTSAPTSRWVALVASGRSRHPPNRPCRSGARTIYCQDPGRGPMSATDEARIAAGRHSSCLRPWCRRPTPPDSPQENRCPDVAGLAQRPGCTERPCERSASNEELARRARSAFRLGGTAGVSGPLPVLSAGGSTSARRCAHRWLAIPQPRAVRHPAAPVLPWPSRHSVRWRGWQGPSRRRGRRCARPSTTPGRCP